MRNNYALKVATGGIIAGLYIVITILVAPIASGPIQIRISEALTILPISPSLTRLTISATSG